MADNVRTAQYFKAQVSDKPGEAARMLGDLRDARVNLIAFTGFPRRRRAQLDFVPDNAAAFKAVAKKGKWKVEGPKTCFLVSGDDRPGAVADVASALAEAKINITALDAVCGGSGRYGAILWVDPKHVKKASKVLGV